MTVVRLQGFGSEIRVNNIFCIGRNYAEHARELNNPIPAEPMVFLKPSSAIIHSGETVVIPQQSADVHHEVEVVALIGKSGRHIAVADALTFVRGYAVGIDVTARDIQSRAKSKGHPWSVAKGFDSFAPVSAFVPADRVADPRNLELQLRINGDIRQQGNTRDMLFPVATLIAHLSGIFTLSPGDLIFTGTPEGVGQLNSGDVLEAVLGNELTALSVDVK